jgi:Protein of unknown function (DUF3551)
VKRETIGLGGPEIFGLAAPAHMDCTFSTLAQCAMSASGRAAQCNVNPYYAGATASLGRIDRRHRRVY